MTHPAATHPATRFRDVVIIGGGCYGTFYASQLQTARARGKASYRRIFLVDHDPGCKAARELRPDPARELVVAEWDPFLAAFLEQAPPAAQEPDDAIVPSPLMPHLMADWLLATARARWPARAVELRPVAQPLGTPYDRLAADGTRYVSFADWICPTHCVEPLTCPVIRGPRTWEMSDALVRYRERLARSSRVEGPALFVTRHRAFGVGMFDVAEARAARGLLEAAAAGPPPADLLVATVSSCHGAISLLHLGEK